MRASLLVVLLSMALLVSCSGDGVEAYYIGSAQEARAYFFCDGRLVEVVADGDVMPLLADGMEAFFAIEAASLDEIDDDDYSQRLGFYDALAWVAGADDGLDAYRDERGNLASFIETVDALTPVFDEEMFADSLADMDEHYTYELADVLGHVPQGREKDFIRLWLTSALN